MDTLKTAGVESSVNERPYLGGTSRQIVLRGPLGVVTVMDQSWRKNRDVWIGWEVDLEGPDGLTVRTWPITKKRAEVAAAVQEALGALKD